VTIGLIMALDHDFILSCMHIKLCANILVNLYHFSLNCAVLIIAPHEEKTAFNQIFFIVNVNKKCICGVACVVSNYCCLCFADYCILELYGVTYGYRYIYTDALCCCHSMFVLHM